MPVKTKAYEQFGHYILFKKLEADSFSDLWRASRIENGALGATVAIRRFTAANREAMAAAAWTAHQIVPNLSGTSFVRNQIIDTIDAVPFVAYDYAGGRSLRHVIDRARGGTGASPMPIPIDQAIAISEKVAHSLATTEELRVGGDRLTHSALIPQLVWITDEGEIRVAGQQLGRGLVSSLRDARIASDIGHYFAPEYRQSGVATKATEVFSIGAILYVTVTGEEPPDAADPAALTRAFASAKTTSGSPLPADIRAILEKSLTAEPASRYASVADMKNAISSVANSGKYSATTFNLAFYLSSLLKKEMEGEAIDREREAKTNVAPYLAPPEPVAVAAPQPVAPAPAPVHAAAPIAHAAPQKPKNKALIGVAAAGAILAIGAGAWVTLGKKPANAATKPQLASALPVAPKPAAVIAEPLVASSTPETTTAATATTAQLDEAAQKKAFEDAVRKKLEQELGKLQAEYTQQLQRQQSKNAPVTTTQPPVTQSVADERVPSAAELDQSRVSRANDAAALTATTAAPQMTQTQPPAVTTQAPVQAPVVAQVRDGDVVEGSVLDVPPRITRRGTPVYPPMAARQKITGTVLLSALVSENGDVIDIKVLKGEGRLGFDEAAIRAAKATKFSPPMKDGKKVRTWVGIPIQFK